MKIQDVGHNLGRYINLSFRNNLNDVYSPHVIRTYNTLVVPHLNLTSQQLCPSIPEIL
jgi:hypothetical protein